MAPNYPRSGPVDRLRKLLLVLLAALLSACQAAVFGVLNLGPTPDTVRVTENLRFDAQNELALDLYRPTAPGKAPIVLFFYGGSWQSGERDWYRFVGETLAAQGLIVAIPDYRKYPDVRYPDFMLDAASALAFSIDAAQEWGGDPQRVFLMGHSAGAHIAALLVSDPRYLATHGLHPSQISGLIGLSGPYDFLPLKSKTLIDLFGDAERQHDSQPVHHVATHVPPMLLLHGDKDRTVWPRNSHHLAQAARDAGAAADVVMLADMGHIAPLLALRPGASRQAEVLAPVLDFVRR